MLYAKVNLAVKQDRTFSNRKIMLYRGDSNVDIEFTLTSSDYVISECKYIQAVLTRPYAPSIFSEVFELKENTFLLTITGDMIDELTELETYSMQLIMFDEAQEDKVTLPPCYDIFDVKKPLATEAARINWAAINYDAVAIDDNETGVGDIFNGNEYNPTNWRDGDVISDIRMNKIEEALSVISHKAGSGGGVSSVYISSDDPEVLVVNEGNDLRMTLNFISPNPGKGTLNVAINNVTAFTTSIAQGGVEVVIPERIFDKGSNTMTIYAIDRAGGLSNTIMFEVRYGSLEFKSDFDSYTAYDVGSSIRYYFTPSSADTSLALTFYMEIDGEIQNGVECVSDTRNYYTFPTSLQVGRHKCQAYVVDANGNMSNKLNFNLVLLDESSIVVSSDTNEVVIEEGLQLSLDFKVYMKNNIRFITKVYVDEKLVNTGSCGLEKSYYKTSSLTEGEHSIRLEVFNESQTVSDSISWGVTVTESKYTMVQATNAGLVFSASAYNKTNSDEGKEKWVGKDQEGNPITASLSNFSFNNESGWVDDSLIISGVSHVEVPVKPLADNAKTGFTLDIEFLSKQIGVEDAEVLTLWDNNKNCGVKITTENIILRSAEGHECNLYFSDNEFTNAIMVIDRQEKKAKIYLNGVMCHAFHLSDYVANGVTYYEDFSVNSNVYLGGKDKNGYSKIKNIRIYDVALTTNEILNNFISNKKDKAEQQALVEFQKGNDLPTMTIYCDFSGLGKDDKKPCKIVYTSTDELKYGKSFILDHKESQLQYQGTSSMAYPIKNYRINLRDSNGDKLYYAFPGGQPECRFTLKADFMSSGHWQNTGFTKWVNDNLYNYKTNDPKSMNPKKWFDINNGGSLTDTRECIYGFPCRLILVNDGTSALNEGQNEPLPGNTKDMGIFNFNHDKDCAATIGLDQVNFPNCASYEIAANSDTSAGAFMSYDTVNPSDVDELGYLKQSFEMRFPDEKEVPEGWGFLGVGEEGTGVKALIDWVDKSTDEEFVRDFEQHFHKDYTLRYYLMVMTCGMVDNLGKNLMLDTWDHKIFMPRFYDCDTICSYDNSGDIKFDVDIEMEQGYWNTSSSRLWTRVRDLMHADLVEKYNNMRQNGLSYESLMSYFYDEQIAKIPQKYYNMDFDAKYAPFDKTYIGMAHGDGYEHLKRWLKKRIIFCDTLFDYAPSYNNDVLTIRANTTEPMTIEIETYTPLYQHVSWYNGQMDKKKIDGKVKVAFTGTAMSATDQEVLIYGGSNVKRITGIQSMKPNQMLIGYATRLTEINASNCTILQDINSDGANLSPHIYLNNVNLSNCSQLSGSLRLDNSPLIRNVDISGSSINGIVLPTSVRNLETLKLSEDVASLTLRDASSLKSLNLPNNIEYLNLYNIPRLTSVNSSSGQLTKLKTLIMENPTINPISNIVSKASNIERVRLTGLDITCSASHMQTLLNTTGVDEFGNDIPVSQAVQGNVRLAQCTENIEMSLRTAFPLVSFTVESYVKSFIVTFKDGNGAVIYEAEVPENGEAIYVGPTPTKKSTAQYDYTFSGWDTPLKPIFSNMTVTATFTSSTKSYTIKFVNGVTGEILSEQVLKYGVTPVAPSLPSDANAWGPSVTSVTGNRTYYSKYFPYPEDLSIFYFSKNGNQYSVNVTGDPGTQLILPFEHEGLPVPEIYGSSTSRNNLKNVTSIFIPDTLTSIKYYAFARLDSIVSIELPPSSGFTTSSYEAFYGCAKMETFNGPGVTRLPKQSSSKKGIFNTCTGLKYVTLGSEETPFTYWGEYNTGISYHHFYNCGKLKFINLVTENGLISDVTFDVPSGMKHTAITNFGKIICSKKPVTPYNDGEYEYMLLDNEAWVVGFYGTYTAAEVVIPSEVEGRPVTRIMNSAFMGKSTIVNVKSQSVKYIDVDSFRSCSNLSAVIMENLETIDTAAFASCTSLTTVNTPKLKYIGSSVFESCSKLKTVISPLIETIGNYGFNGCSVLETLSSDLHNVTDIGMYAFKNCKKLNTAIYMPNVETIKESTFSSCLLIPSINIPNVTEIGTSAMYMCSGMTELIAPKVTKLGKQSLQYCEKLTLLDMPELTSVDDYSLSGCIKLTELNFPKLTTVNGTSGYTFSSCSDVTSINLPLLTKIPVYAFSMCSRVTSVNVPLAEDIGQNSFYGTGSLTSLSLPSVTTIGYSILGSSGVTALELGGVGKPISDTSSYNENALYGWQSSGTPSVNIYVSDPSNPPSLAGSPWGCSSAIITYHKA